VDRVWCIQKTSVLAHCTQPDTAHSLTQCTQHTAGGVVVAAAGCARTRVVGTAARGALSSAVDVPLLVFEICSYLLVLAMLVRSESGARCVC
jgi:hypothetical protein